MDLFQQALSEFVAHAASPGLSKIAFGTRRQERPVMRLVSILNLSLEAKLATTNS